MKTNLNRIGIKDLNIFDGLSPRSSVETVRIVFKSGGVSAYLPRSIVKFLNLDRGQDRALVAILDSGGQYNYIVLLADRDLISLLRPIILSRRERAQQLQQELKKELQAQQHQQTEAKQGGIMIDTEVRA